MKLYKIDEAQRLYVLHEGRGFSCLGFDVIDRRARAMAEEVIKRGEGTIENMRVWLALLDDTANYAKGTPEHYAVCANIYDYAQINASVFGQLSCGLHPALVGYEGKRITCLLNGERKRFNVGRSTGWVPCHLAVHNRRSRGGDAIDPTYMIEDVQEVRQ